ncbi:hypothetical protein EPA93_18570 [Ktedonosporobacter rubrisoli]|uniref:Uncharacterized protein n=1 Tax=Ktedonosporobacter rubrisoli TaxID=2509675 RepID=A0A4P6JR25_KTERU|nr:hypothetical protein [Ktedonosporobacter rubrisoli]QBD77888.1 hypothetical protein EPA93_18570 [Ktedonosporobacter rubrisoli]
MQNRNNAYDAVNLRLVSPEPERIQGVLGLIGRDVSAVEGRSMEVYRGGQYLCSLRTSEDGMGADAKPADTQARLRSGDVIYYVDLEPRILYLSGMLTTRDSYNPTYNAEVTIRVNNPSTFLRCYFQAFKDYRLDPIIRFKASVERAFRRYAESVGHDKLKRRDFESAAFKNHEGRNLGIWIVRSVADIMDDPQRRKIREIEKQTEIEKAKERSKAEVQRVKSNFTQIEDSKQKAYNRREKSKDTNFELEQEAKRQAHIYQQKLREIVFNTVNPQWAEYILKELDKVDNSIPEFFRQNPAVLQYFPGLLQLQSLQPPQLFLEKPSADIRGQNVTDMRLNNSRRRQGEGGH